MINLLLELDIDLWSQDQLDRLLVLLKEVGEDDAAAELEEKIESFTEDIKFKGLSIEDMPKLPESVDKKKGEPE